MAALAFAALTATLLAACVFGLFGVAAETARAAGDDCRNAEIRASQNSQHLPDCRAYEKVSPAAKGNTDVSGVDIESFSKASLDGDGIVYSSRGAFPGLVQGGALPFSYRALRTEDGWVNEGITPPSKSTWANCGHCSAGNTGQVMWLTPDLQRAVVGSNLELVPGSSTATNLFTQDNPGSNWSLMTPGGPSEADVAMAPQNYMYFGTATEDLDHVVFSTGYAMNPGDPSSTNGNYFNIYESVDGEVRLVSIDSAGNPIAETRVSPGTPGRMLDALRPNTISENGSRIVFDAQGFPGGEVHIRIDGSTTVQIPFGDEMLAANAAVSQVLYHQGGSSPSAIKLFDVDEETSADVVGEADCNQCEFIAASEDLSRVYFIDNQEQVPGQDPLPDGAVGLYLWDEGAVELVSSVEISHNDFIWTLDWAKRRVLAAWQDGSKLAFVAGRVDDVDREGRYNAFLFDAETSELVCMSCPSDGAPSSRIDDRTALWGGLAGQSGTTYPYPFENPNSISADGSRVIFQTTEALVPRDSNGKYDVYMWEDGEPKLLSDGVSRHQAIFVNADPTGDNVFIASRSRWAGGDKDEYVDLYDARVAGGFAEQAGEPAPCEGDSCQSDSPSGPPALETPSGDIDGAGNPKQPVDCGALERRAGKLSKRVKRMKRKTRLAAGNRKENLRVRTKQAKRRAKVAKNRLAECRDGGKP